MNRRYNKWPHKVGTVVKVIHKATGKPLPSARAHPFTRLRIVSNSLRQCNDYRNTYGGCVGRHCYSGGLMVDAWPCDARGQLDGADVKAQATGGMWCISYVANDHIWRLEEEV